MPDLLEEFEKEASALDRRAFQEWNKCLNDGEKMLWDGKPCLEALTLKRQNVIKSLSITSLVMAALFFLIPLVEKFEDTSKVELLRMLAFIFAITGISAFLVGREIVGRLNISNYYGISTAYAIVVKHKSDHSVWRFPIDKMDQVQLVRDRFDTVFFARRLHSNDHWVNPWEAIPDTEKVYLDASRRFEKRGFENLANGTEAYHILKAAKDALR